MPRKIVQEITAVDNTKRAFDSVSRSLGNLRGLFAGLGAAISIGAIGRVAQEALRGADEINKLSTQLGISTEALSQYQFVAERTGVSFNALTTALQRQSRRIAEAAQGTGVAASALDDLGLSAQALQQLAPEQQFEIIAERIDKVENSSQKVALAFKLWDSEGVKLLRTTEGGAAAIQALRTEADDAGLTISQQFAASASEAQDALTRVGSISSALSITLASQLAPIISDVANFIARNLPRAVDFAIRAFNGLRFIALDTAATFNDWLAQFQRFDAAVTRALGFDQWADSVEEAANQTQRSANTIRQDLVAAIAEADAQQQRFSLRISQGIDFQKALAVATLQQGQSNVRQRETIDATTRALQQQQEQIGNYIQRLKDQRATIDATNSEIVAYELAQLGAKPATVQLALAIQEEINAMEALKEKTREAAVEAEQLKAFAENLTRAVNPAQELAEELDRIERAFAAGLISADTYAEGIFQALEKAQNKVKETGKELEENEKFAERFGATIADGFGDAIANGESLRNTLKALKQDLIRLITRQLVTAPLGNFLGDLLKGFNIGSIFGRQAGGSVLPGQPYVVGERGPEIIVPATQSEVKPNVVGNTTINVIVQGVQDAASFVRNQGQVARAAGQALRQAQAF